MIWDREAETASRPAMRALQAVESTAAAAGATSIGLNVFANNKEAQALYQKLGYVPTNLNMYKSLVRKSA